MSRSWTGLTRVATVTDTRCWFVSRNLSKREPGIDTDKHCVDALEVERVVKSTDTNGATLFLKCGGVAYSHRTPVEVAEDFGWR